MINKLKSKDLLTKLINSDIFKEFAVNVKKFNLNSISSDMHISRKLEPVKDFSIFIDTNFLKIHSINEESYNDYLYILKSINNDFTNVIPPSELDESLFQELIDISDHYTRKEKLIKCNSNIHVEITYSFEAKYNDLKSEFDSIISNRIKYLTEFHCYLIKNEVERYCYSTHRYVSKEEGARLVISLKNR